MPPRTVGGFRLTSSLVRGGDFLLFIKTVLTESEKMAKQKTAEETTKESAEPAVGSGPVLPFAIQADEERNGNLRIKNITNCTLRGRVVSNRTVFDPATQEHMTPVDQTISLGGLPELPGMVLRVFPSEFRFEVSDPLATNEKILERVQQWMRQKTGARVQKLKGVETYGGVLDPDTMKSLVREMCDIVNAGNASVCEGVLPERSDVDELPGKYLLNPGLTTFTTQPRYEEDWDEFVRTLATHAG